MTTPHAGRGQLTVDLHAVEDNYRTLQQVASGADVAGVVKADAYGLGVDAVARTLQRAGCRHFFVAKLDEAVELRPIVPEASIYVFDGVTPGSEQTLLEHRLVPVVNSLDQLQRWQATATAQTSAADRDHGLPTVLHVDTGMLRLGLTPGDAVTIARERNRLDGLDVVMVMSHLASADEPDSDQSEQQLEAFGRVRGHLPMGRASLANSAGLHRSPDFRFDVVRPGYALYGGHPQPLLGHPNPMKPVVSVEVPVLQLRWAVAGETIGYGASHRFYRPAKVATLAVGYADGFLRSGSNRSSVVLNGQRLPVIGRISMDLVTIDVTKYKGAMDEGTMVEVIGSNRGIDDVAGDAGTIGYEVLTSLGKRYHRRYLGDSD